MRTTLRVIGVGLFAGSLVTLVAGAAYAQGVEGGCTATVNGADPSTLTDDHPLKVGKDDTVALTGTVPSSVTARRVESETEVFVIVAGVRVPVSDNPGTGSQWGDTADIPGVITDLAPGIYRVEGEASGTGGWSCEGSAYVEVEGGPFTAAMGLGAALLAVGALVTKRAFGKTSPGGDLKAMMAKVRPALRDQVPNLKHDPRPGARLSAAMAGATAVAAVLAATAVELPESLIGLAAPAAAAGARGDRVWLKGRPVGGFFGGLLMGFGLALIIHQFGVWPLDTTQGLAFPLASAVLWAVRGRIGRAFLVSTTTAEPPAEESPE